MNKPVEIFILFFGFFWGNFFEDLALKILFTVIAMVIGTTVSFYWKRYLIKKNNKKHGK